MKVKPKRAWSAFGWVSAKRYNIGSSIATPKFGGLLHEELEALHGHKGFGWVCPWTTVSVVGCWYCRVCRGTAVDVVGWRGARLSESTRVKRIRRSVVIFTAHVLYAYNIDKHFQEKITTVNLFKNSFFYKTWLSFLNSQEFLGNIFFWKNVWVNFHFIMQLPHKNSVLRTHKVIISHNQGLRW